MRSPRALQSGGTQLKLQLRKYRWPPRRDQVPLGQTATPVGGGTGSKSPWQQHQEHLIGAWRRFRAPNEVSGVYCVPVAGFARIQPKREWIANRLNSCAFQLRQNKESRPNCVPFSQLPSVQRLFFGAARRCGASTCAIRRAYFEKGGCQS